MNAPRQTDRGSAGDLALLATIVGMAALLLAWTYPLWGSAFSVACPLRTITGLPCPTCGGTRAMVAAARGDWWMALRTNPMIGAAGVGLLFCVPWSAAAALAGWRIPWLALLGGRLARGLLVAAVLANWVYLLAADLC